jgi:hypothetical protein
MRIASRNIKLLCVVAILAIMGTGVPVKAQLITNNGTEITLKSGIEITINGDITNQLDGEFINNGTIDVEGNQTNNASTGMYTGDGLVVLSGSSIQSISGSSLILFNDLELNNSAGAELQQSIYIDSSFTFTNGNIDLNGNDIDLSPEGKLLGENDSKRIMGFPGVIRITKSMDTPLADDPGNLGAVITSNEDLGFVTIERGHEQQTGIGNNSIYRYYDIIPDNNGGLDATLRFNYLDPELDAQDETGFTLWRSIDNGTTWSNEFGTVNVTSNYVELANIDAFSRWTVSNVFTNPLPIELLEFEAEKTGDNVLTKWVTASETNNAYFNIERSAGGIIFEKIGEVQGAGNSNSMLSYQFVDENPLIGQNYYRLKQVDFNGDFSYSDIATIFFEGTALKEAFLYPNPVQSGNTIRMKGAPKSVSTLRIFDALGKTVFEAQNLNGEDFQLQAGTISSGHYTYSISINNKTTMGQLIVTK